MDMKRMNVHKEMCMKDMRRLSGIKHKMWACD
jgi:hypothetical protein